MQVTVRFSGGKRSDFGDHNFEEILLGSLQRFRHMVTQAYLYFEDTNGPRGGVDKQCRCVIHLRRMRPVVIQDVDANLQALIYRVSNRAAYALSQRSARSRVRPARRVASSTMMRERRLRRGDKPFPRRSADRLANQAIDSDRGASI